MAVKKIKAGIGDVIQFRYNINPRYTNAHDETPVVIILNPNWKGLLHGINLKYLGKNKRAIDRIYKLFNPSTSRARKRLKMLEEDPYSLYHSKIKRETSKLIKSCYRTYSLKYMKGIIKLDLKKQTIWPFTHTKARKLDIEPGRELAGYITGR